MTPAEVLKREQARAEREKLELALALQLRADKIQFEAQATFWVGREWRLDFLIGRTSCRVGVEVQGGIWRAKGAHNTGAAITRDCEKAAHAAIVGIRLIPVTAQQIKTGKALQWIKHAMVTKCASN